MAASKLSSLFFSRCCASSTSPQVDTEVMDELATMVDNLASVAAIVLVALCTFPPLVIVFMPVVGLRLAAPTPLRHSSTAQQSSAVNDLNGQNQSLASSSTVYFRPVPEFATESLRDDHTLPFSVHWLLMALPFFMSHCTDGAALIGLSVGVGFVYQRSSQELKRLDSTTRSPIYQVALALSPPR